MSPENHSNNPSREHEDNIEQTAKIRGLSDERAKLVLGRIIQISEVLITEHPSVLGQRKRIVLQPKPTLRLPERQRPIIEEVRREIDEVKNGQRNTLSTPSDLAERHGYTGTSISRILRRAGIQEDRKAITSRRQTDLTTYIAEQLQKYQNNEISSMPTRSELADMFGYSRRQVQRVLKSTGLDYNRGLSKPKVKIDETEKSPALEETKPTEKSKESSAETELEHSTDTAWMIGVLAGGGTVSPKKGEIALQTSEEAILNRFIDVAERLLQKTPKIRTILHSPKGKVYKRASFFSTSYAEVINNLGRDHLPETFMSRHSWILSNQAYGRSFIKGLFELRGHVDKRGMIRFNTSYPSVANFIADLLVRLGVENPRLIPAKAPGVGIFNQRDINLFAQIVHSDIPEKESRLEVLRIKTINPLTKIPDKDLLTEWVRLIEVLGRIPTSYDIIRLKKANQTRYSHTAYINRFGEGSYLKAKGELKRLTGIT